jgi:hypothetical protein
MPLASVGFDCDSIFSSIALGFVGSAKDTHNAHRQRIFMVGTLVRLRSVIKAFLKWLFKRSSNFAVSMICIG